MQLPLPSGNHFALAGALCGLFGCASGAPAPSPNPDAGPATSIHTFPVDTGYGTLSFRGTVDRTDRGRNYVYRVHIDVTFHARAPFNRTPVADLRECRLVASAPRNANGPWQALDVETRSISVRLAQDGQTAHLPDLTFRLPRAIAAKAQHVGLTVSDGRLMWPIPINLQ